MLTVVSDTHSTDGHKLRGRTLEAVREADLVIHAGDFMRASVLDAFENEARTFRGVYGNNDDSEIRDRLPKVRTVEYEGFRLAVTHTVRGGATALSLVGRERDADAVIFGHSHKPTVDLDGELPLVNPGSHAQPRGNHKAHAEFEPSADGLDGRLVTPEGEVFERFTLPTPES
ncbi:metallophosphoesterase [Halonotius terrestris]|uniref:Phosphoesterase n=1 Tax=Halonotius terrestris TaxID=2487750 RepID=A0A8J8P983_9EURY|nr:metallophosphoesterase [Halonotius terrestris]TQQ80851.1 metallophosphoesterase [Halonotius terrestris]